VIGDGPPAMLIKSDSAHRKLLIQEPARLIQQAA